MIGSLLRGWCRSAEKEPQETPRIVLMPVAEDLARSRVEDLRGLTLDEPVLAAVLRLLCAVHASVVLEGERRECEHPEQAVAEARGVSRCVSAIVAATRGRLPLQARAAQTGFAGAAAQAQQRRGGGG